MTVESQPGRPTDRERGLLARHPLVSYFAMAYFFSWLVWSPQILSEDGVGVLPFHLPALAAGLLTALGILLGPTMSAFVMTGKTEGRPGVRRLLRRYVLWRVGFQWYLFALLGIPLVMVLGAIAAYGDLPDVGALGGPSFLLTYVATFVLAFVLGGPLLEEPGWRGFALPRLQRLHGPLVGTLILGVLWGAWHLPEFLIPSWAASSGGASFLNIVLFFVIATLFAIAMTWVFNNTKGSLLLVMLVHCSIDTFAGPEAQLFEGPVADSSLALLIGFGALAVVLVAVTKGRLSYRQDLATNGRSPSPPTA